MANPLRAATAWIGRWPGWLKIVSAGAVTVLVVAAVAIPVALRLRAQPVAAAHRAASSPTPSGPGVILSPGADSLVADLTCRVPISSYAPGSGGFVGFPSAAFTSDPASSPADQSRYGYSGLTYDRAAGKWLPAARAAVTPDGSRFVYWSGTDGGYRLVNVATKAETGIGPRLNGPAWFAASPARQNWNSGGPAWSLVEAAADGVYAAPPGGASLAGLWFFPYSGSAERQVAGFGYWQGVGGGAAWGTRAPTVPQGATETIVRLDLASGASADWFSQDGEYATVIGFDSAGHPVVVTDTKSDFQVWLVDGQKHGTQLLNLPRDESTGQGYGNEAPVQSVVGDTTGVWMATSDGLYLYRNGRTQKVSTVTGQLGGGCGA